MNSINPKIPVVSPRSAAQIEALALSLLQELSPESLNKPSAIPACELFDYLIPNKFGFKSGVQKMAKGLEGYTDVAARTVFLSSNVYEELEFNDGRARFSAMHESGHVVLHGMERNLSVSTSGGGMLLARKTEIPAYQNPEWQANQFASSILLPAPMVRQLAMMSGLRNELLIKQTMETFKVSYSAAKFRLEKLGLVARV